LTKFFVLSNIRFVSGGSSECRGPRDVFAQTFSNPAGLGRFQRLRPTSLVFPVHP
jgi:hypothetical protein